MNDLYTYDKNVRTNEPKEEKKSTYAGCIRNKQKKAIHYNFYSFFKNVRVEMNLISAIQNNNKMRINSTFS